MPNLLIAFLFFLISVAHAEETIAPAAPNPNTEFSIIKTSEIETRESLLFSGGSFSKEVGVVFSTILVKHGDDLLLFDTGLGTRIADQYSQDMPVFERPFFRYGEPVAPAVAQLAKAGISPIKKIILSHSHWDHASAIADFPDAEVWLAPEELEVVRHAASGLGGAWPSQVSSESINWKTFDFQPVPYEGFAQSVDLFGDGSVVLVAMPGHTPGSIGMFVKVGSGKRYFFVGDAVWNAGALKDGQPKFWAARMLADKNVAQAQNVIEQIRAVLKDKSDVTVIPAHDSAVQGALGYFPTWIK